MPIHVGAPPIPAHLTEDSRFRYMMKWSRKKGWEWAYTRVKERMTPVFMDVDYATTVDELDAIVSDSDYQVALQACKLAIPVWHEMFWEGFENRKRQLEQLPPPEPSWRDYL